MAALTSRFPLGLLGLGLLGLGLLGLGRCLGLGLVCATLTGCGDLQGLQSDGLTPLVRIRVRVVGDIEEVRLPHEQPPELRVALLWGQPWLPDASCIPPFENPAHADLAASGCGDPLGFRRAGFGFGFGFEEKPDAAVASDGTAILDLYSVPSALFGDMYSQIVYGSVVVYDDINRNAVLDNLEDTIYGASFRSMSKPDTRVAFRHGAFDDRAAYYPRRGCPPPVEGFSIVSTGGFTLEQAMQAQLHGELPEQDPAQCAQDSTDREIAVELLPVGDVGEVNCQPFTTGIYSPPPPMQPLETQLTACTSIPDRGTGLSFGKSQLLIAQAFQFNRACKFVLHVLLRGCFNDPFCTEPQWDVARPAWWPCRVETAQ
jgi:hypothetical protein